MPDTTRYPPATTNTQFVSQQIELTEATPVQAGVTCLKIEGRLKGPEYVALTTRVYRDAVDQAWADLAGPPSPADAALTLENVKDPVRTRYGPGGTRYGPGTDPVRTRYGPGTDQGASSSAVDATMTVVDEKTLRDQRASSSSTGAVLTVVDEKTRRDLQQVFARGQDQEHTGLTPGFLDGPRHQRLVQGKQARHRGVCLGRCCCWLSWRPCATTT
jgi:hypothetical protein